MYRSYPPIKNGVIENKAEVMENGCCERLGITTKERKHVFTNDSEMPSYSLFKLGNSIHKAWPGTSIFRD